MDKFIKATIAKNIHKTPLSTHLEIDLQNKAHRASYQIPGQYAELTLPGIKPGTFAMSSPPSEKIWSFLIKKSSPLSEKLAELDPGDQIEITKAQGKGFDLQKARGKNVLFFAAGSGIAPIRASLLAILANRYQHGSLTLFYGVRNSNEFAYQNEFSQWLKAGVQIRQTLSNKNHPDWPHNFGYVQQMIEEEISIENSVALVCGMEAMVEDVRQKLMEKGMPQENILLNI